ncbi:IclR family transcriptional regulator [Alteribacter populi]|uniref:IclR family transcriptional regulator n=1 Tax=Alteribacter populi TaxID=2011011 RepID=UPI001FE0B569|nr:IclR family transcriptional regulator [Alteribacter populi]
MSTLLKTVDLALKILLMFINKSTWSSRELAKELDMNHSNIYRILTTLENNKFLLKDDETKKYSLSISAWELGMAMNDQIKLSKLVRPKMKNLMQTTGESIFLTGLDSLEGITLDCVEPENKVKFSVTIGSRAPLYVGASYLVILAYMEEEKIDKVLRGELKPFTKNTKTDPKSINEMLVQIRETGWAVSEGEYTPDVIAIAFPIFDFENKIIGSLTLSGPTYRMQEEKIRQHLIELENTTKEITDDINKYSLTLKRYFNS